MNVTGFKALIGVTVLVVVAAVYATTESDSSAATLPEVGQPLFPDLAERLNDAAMLTIESADGSFSLRREGAEWVMADWGGYPAEFDAVKKVIVAAADLEIVDGLTDKPEFYDKLGVQDPGEDGAPSTRVRIADESGTELANVVVGNRKSGRTKALYARRDGEARSWLVKGELAPQKRPGEWVDRELLRLDNDRLARVDIEHGDGELVSIVRSDEGGDAWEVENVPEGFEMPNNYMARAVASAANWLDFEKVVPNDELPELTAEDWTTTRFQMNDGMLALARTAKVDETVYTQVAFEQIEVVEEVTEEAPDEDAETEDAAPDEGEDVGEKIARLNERFGAWTFTLPSWKADQLRKRMDDLVTPIEEEIEEETDAAGDEAGSEDVDLPFLIDEIPEPEEPAEPPQDG